MNTPADHDPDLRGAEYALGVLDADARIALERAAQTDPALQEAIECWARRLAPLADDLPPVEPPARVWTRLSHDLGFLPRATPARGWWDNLALWRWIGLGASAVALVLIAINLVWLRQPAPPAATIAAAPSYMVATIARQDGVAHWTATVDLRRARIVVVPAVRPTVPADRATELWLIVPNAKPVPLGVFPSDAPATLSLPPQIVASVDAKALLAVSIEPPGGSPTGQPTGPVVATGAMHPAS
ncbi:MAG: anti-sigma factor [Burkholderia sp.]|jgi:anti-sigma-K factor RskA|uniref:anti-sigma factor n=1 Tax=Burkholderia TaxID=32008 RepID=UPI001CA3EE6B|nr:MULTISPECIES: anti-sigma factor [Burkholderia]MBY8606876.1 anti-sigma factor [Burkholderia arboris]MCA3777438.1 anti-sigma factor [Burkholderia sp.]MCA3792381.1 anti-sigma factor [Burkholderia sp.]MCA3803043.1 anti-sigma factor [Burkholderia sp.]MCA3811747.1 anti-sigma factor [Burkholderia sp.]